jgi:hypothetical protein
MTEASVQKIAQNFGPKDYLVLLPVSVSAMALSYDVGCFTVYGHMFMGFFSFTEHLVFAVEALPFAIFGGVAIALIMINLTGPATRPPTSMVKRIIVLCILLACAVVSLFILGLWVPGAILFSVAIALIIMSLPSPPAAYLLACLALIIPLFLSLAVGIDWANLQKFYPKQQQIVTTSAEFERTVLRAGERGILVLDRVSQQTDFLPWDQIRGVSKKTNFLPWIYRFREQ